MTAEEAISGIQELSRRFEKGYKWRELQRVWPQLLRCSHQAMVRAVGVIIKNGRYRPDPDYLLQRVEWWHARLRDTTETDMVIDPDEEGKEVLQVMQDFFHGRMTGDEYVKRLYVMSKKYRNPLYAIQARDFESV